MIHVLTVLILAICALGIWRFLDHGADRAEMKRLIALQPQAPEAFRLAMVEDLPEPARRFFAFAIAEGTPLYTVAELTMEGRFSLGTKDAPEYMDMEATQVLAAPEGFVWKMSSPSAHLGVSGSDSATWTRFWLGGLVPVARLGGDADHARSAFGRYAAEAVFWTPAAVLPGPTATWEAVDADTSQVTIRKGDLEQTVTIRVAENGQPTQVEFPRWSNANPDKTYRIQMFGGYLSEFRDVQGFRVPTHVEAGNFFGTDDYFPFFIAEVTEIRFPSPE